MMVSRDLITAANRFGLGLRRDETLLQSTDPLQSLLTELYHRALAMPASEQLPYSPENYRRFREARQSQDEAKLQEARRILRQAYLQEMRVKLWHSVTTPQGFMERLVNFWSNHFTISIQKGIVSGFVGAYEREAIRPHVTGDFATLLVAVTRHPAMLIYLDNVTSTGPNSRVGRNRKIGLNENLAREIFELHTLGVAGGYTQNDVTNFARVLTGWSLGDLKQGDAVGQFFFDAARHEPGSQIILGKTYEDMGEQQGIAVLRDLAQHPATARHLATKLTRHFLADEPPAETVTALAESYLRHGGNLAAMYQTMLTRSEFWQTQPLKIRSSFDLVIAAARHCGLEVKDMDWCLQSLRFLGQMPFNANSPAGFPDTGRALAGPEAMLRRIEWAEGAGARFGTNRNAMEIAELALGSFLQVDSQRLIATANTPREALAILLATPEFQRR